MCSFKVLSFKPRFPSLSPTCRRVSRGSCAVPNSSKYDKQSGLPPRCLSVWKYAVVKRNSWTPIPVPSRAWPAAIPLSFESVQSAPAVVGFAAVGLVVIAAFLLYLRRKYISELKEPALDDKGDIDTSRTPEKAVLIFGSTGKLGRAVVETCLANGLDVVAAGRRDEKHILARFSEKLSDQDSQNTGRLFPAPAVDVARPETLSGALFRGVEKIIIATGPRLLETSSGQPRFAEGSSPEEVDAKGTANVVAAAERYLPRQQRKVELVAGMRSPEEAQAWKPLDDVIMGGRSSSALAAPGPDGAAAWRGRLVVEGGGFCGLRTDAAEYGLGAYDGVCLRVKAAGQRFKLNLKTSEQVDAPESTYQASFDTAEDGRWTTVLLPWHAFRCVKRAKFDPSGPPLDPSSVRQLGLVYSRFEFNGLPNRFYSPGEFELLIDGGIFGYRDPRPQIVQVSSAGVERNARVAGDDEARSKEIPIVRLNPGGILDYKYEGELAVRASSLTYTIVRPTGLEQSDESKGATRPCRPLEACQGDAISGKISREEVARVVCASLFTPFSVGKTFEVRCSEAADCQDKAMTDKDMLRLFLNLHTDWDRGMFALEPFPQPAEIVKVVPATSNQHSEGARETPPRHT
eukprot:CAMPEP_0177587416 /NCGR_PEP_ID=MMETSP0419_2-20121207/5637_1 /TAXON_ID=582737 /ORGANISM="Tetraselmis sp., Strain GSL018" /LENGTH=629 /DNA_ID=CAMNT_0019077459 /DNA_START=24 /DNA_END=1913 /DNA_ORIENTATION=+